MKTQCSLTLVTLALMLSSAHAFADVCFGGGYKVMITERVALVQSDRLNITLRRDKSDGDAEDRDAWPSYSNGSKDVATNITVTYYNELEHGEAHYTGVLDIGEKDGAFLDCEGPL